MWSCSPSANVTCPDIDGFYDRRAAPFQLNNIIKERPEKAKELFDKLRLFMGELKTMYVQPPLVVFFRLRGEDSGIPCSKTEASIPVSPFPA